MNTIVKALIVSLLSSALVSAQAASYTIVDRSGVCPSSPSTRVSDPFPVTLPKIGTTFVLRVPRGFSGSHRGLAVLMTGLRRSRYSINFTHCQGVDTRITGCGVVGLAPLSFLSSFTAEIRIPIPPMLPGIRFYQQVLFSTSGCNWAPGGSCTFPKCFHDLRVGPMALGVVGT